MLDRCDSLRGKKSTPEFKERWLRALTERKSVSDACRVAECSRQHAHWLRQRDPEFARRWDEIFEADTDMLEKSLFTRAVKGWNEPVYYQGKRVGYRRVYDNRLGEFLLSARRPERYRVKNHLPTRPPEEIAHDIIDAVARMNAATSGTSVAA